MNNTVSQQEYKINPLIKGVMDENNTLMLEILNHLIYLSTRFQRVFISQGTLAAKFGVTVRWVNHILAEWKKRGVLRFEQQGFNRSCIYFINPLLVKEKERLKWKLSAVKLLLCVSSLSIAVFGEEFLLSNIRNIPIWKMTTIRDEGNGFYEGYHRTSTIIFVKKNNQAIEKQELCLKESVMSQQAIINIISQAYNLSIEQQEQLSRYSFEALEYARKELYRQQKQNSLGGSQSATSWFSAVASSFEKKALQPKTGRQMSFAQKKVVAPMFNSSHSPSSESSKLTIEERIQFSSDQESMWEEIVDRGETLDVMGIHQGYAERAKTNWKRIALNPREFPTSSEGFKENYDEASHHGEGDLDYEAHLDEISKDKTDPAGYKLMVRRTDYRKTKR